MRQCISIIGKLFRNLWRTLKKYVCKRKLVIKDTNNDNIPDIVLESDHEKEE